VTVGISPPSRLESRVTTRAIGTALY